MNRLKELRKAAGLSQQELADALSVHQTLISQIEREVVVPSGQLMVELADYFGVSTDYLLGRDEVDAAPKSFFVPVLGRVAAGLPLFVAEDIIDWEELPEAWKRQGDYFCLEIHGQSMEPRMCEGDIVVVRKQDTCESGDTAIVLVNGDEATCKRVVFQDEGVTLISNNPMFPPQFITAEKVRTLPVQIIGVVVELRAKFH